MPVAPELSLAKILEVLPDAAAFALLGAIESLLCAVVADGMTRRRHRSNCELVAQGVANLGSALFGGISVTGTVARTATNVRAGARSPVAGMVHSVALLAILMVAGPLCGFIPLSALAGVLIVVAWNMLERHALAGYFATSRSAFAVAVLTLVLTLFTGLIEAIVAGSLVSWLLARRARRG